MLDQIKSTLRKPAKILALMAGISMAPLARGAQADLEELLDLLDRDMKGEDIFASNTNKCSVSNNVETAKFNPNPDLEDEQLKILFADLDRDMEKAKEKAAQKGKEFVPFAPPMMDDSPESFGAPLRSHAYPIDGMPESTNKVEVVAQPNKSISTPTLADEASKKEIPTADTPATKEVKTPDKPVVDVAENTNKVEVITQPNESISASTLKDETSKEEAPTVNKPVAKEVKTSDEPVVVAEDTNKVEVVSQPSENMTVLPLKNEVQKQEDPNVKVVEIQTESLTQTNNIPEQVVKVDENQVQILPEPAKSEPQESVSGEKLSNESVVTSTNNENQVNGDLLANNESQTNTTESVVVPENVDSNKNTEVTPRKQSTNQYDSDYAKYEKYGNMIAGLALFGTLLVGGLLIAKGKKKKKIRIVQKPQESGFQKNGLNGVVFEAMGVDVASNSRKNAVPLREQSMIENSNNDDDFAVDWYVEHAAKMKARESKKDKVASDSKVVKPIPGKVSKPEQKPTEETHVHTPIINEESYLKGVRMLANNKAKRSVLTRQKKALVLERQTASIERQVEIDQLLDNIADQRKELSLQRRQACVLVKGKKGEEIREERRIYAKKMAQIRRLKKKDGLEHLEEIEQINAARMALKEEEKKLIAKAKEDILERAEKSSWVRGIRALKEMQDKQKDLDQRVLELKKETGLKKKDVLLSDIQLYMEQKQLKKARRDALRLVKGHSYATRRAALSKKLKAALAEQNIDLAKEISDQYVAIKTEEKGSLERAKNLNYEEQRIWLINGKTAQRILQHREAIKVKKERLETARFLRGQRMLYHLRNGLSSAVNGNQTTAAHYKQEALKLIGNKSEKFNYPTQRCRYLKDKTVVGIYQRQKDRAHS